MRLTLRTDRPWFTVVTTFRTFLLQARDLAEARDIAPGSIIGCIESVVEVKP